MAPDLSTAVEQDQSQDHAAHEEDAIVSSTFELVLLIPTQDFVSIPRANNAQANSEGYLELPLPSQPTEAVHDLKSIITESPEGFWLGSFGLKPVVAEQIGASAAGKEHQSGEQAVDGEAEEQTKQWGAWKDLEAPVLAAGEEQVDEAKIWRLTSEGVLGDYADLTAVFSGDFEGRRRGLKVVPTSFSSLGMNQHIIRVRDTLFSNLANLAAANTYDPSSVAVGAGQTVYSIVRGEPSEEAQAQAALEKEREEAQAQQDASSASAKNKKGNKNTKKAEKTSASVEEPTTPATDAASNPIPPSDVFKDFKLNAVDPTSLFSLTKPAALPSVTSPCLRSLGVSPWSPPPHVRRLRGDHVYLTITTLEGESYTITGATSGFWIAKTTSNHFDPSPRAVLPNKMRSGSFQSLFELLSALSPTFSKGLAALLDAQHNGAHGGPDIYASLPISHAHPAAPWLVHAPQHSADPLRTQLAYLITGSTAADQLPAARDWNDEFAQYKELPQASVSERLMRERLQARVHADFTNAAVQGALSIARGDIPPLNPNEQPAAHTWVHNNMLFTRASDAVGAYAHLGGDEASHYAAAKDLAGVQLLEKLEVDDVHSMTTVLVDYAGERWVAQSLIPGLFKTKDGEEDFDGADPTVYPADDAEAKQTAQEALASDKPFPNATTSNKGDYPNYGPFRIVYGSADPEKADAKIRASAYFHELAAKVAKGMRFAEHKVYDTDGNESKLWTSADTHGIATPDGRSYLIDCSRLHCVDVEFLENDVEGSVASGSSQSQVNGSQSSAAYPHRLVLLRPELLELYHDSKLKVWLDERVAEIRARVEKESADKAGSIEAELKDAATDVNVEAGKSDEAKDPAKDEEAQAAVPTSVVNAEDFVLRFNPDAFVERKPLKEGESAPKVFDADEESSRNVREASKFLRGANLSSFLTEIVSSSMTNSDGFFLSKLMHRKGINMRYLGLLVKRIEEEREQLIADAPASKEDAASCLNLLKQTLELEMVIRASKHILRRLIKTANAYDHPYIVSHFFNCLLGTSFQPRPVAEVPELATGVNADRAWTALEPESLRDQIRAEAKTRFRYSLPASVLEAGESLVPRKLLREISMRVGVQLVAREYNFSAGANGIAAATSEATSAPVLDEKKEVNGSASSSKKKKSGSKKAAAAAESRPVNIPAQTFRPEDVLNIMPVVKTSVQKSALADESFLMGQRSITSGQIELGFEQMQDSLQFCEQVLGAVHSEASVKYHGFGIIYHQLATALSRKIQTHEFAESTIKNRTDLAPEDKQKLEELLIEDIDAVRGQCDTYIQQAARMVRQSVVIAERTLGLDAPETIQQYTDLGILEQALGNFNLAMRFTKHAITLWASVYGLNHPSVHALLTNASTMVQQDSGVLEAVPLLTEIGSLVEQIWGRDSLNFAQVDYSLAQAYAQNGDFAASLPYMKSALNVFEKVLAKDSKETAEAQTFVQLVEAQLKREAEERTARQNQLKKKVPKVGSSNGGQQQGTAVTSSSAAAAAEVAPPAHGQKANLSVDELVNFIQGTAARTGTAPGKSSSKVARKRKASPPS